MRKILQKKYSAYNITGNSLNERITQILKRVRLTKKENKMGAMQNKIDVALQKQYNRSIGVPPVN